MIEALSDVRRYPSVCRPTLRRWTSPHLLPQDGLTTRSQMYLIFPARSQSVDALAGSIDIIGTTSGSWRLLFTVARVSASATSTGSLPCSATPASVHRALCPQHRTPLCAVSVSFRRSVSQTTASNNRFNTPRRRCTVLVLHCPLDTPQWVPETLVLNIFRQKLPLPARRCTVL